MDPNAPRPLKFAGPEIDEQTIAGVADVLRSGHITSGPWVREFEARLSTFCGDRPVRVLTSATAAIEVALQLAGIGPGAEVITSAQSFFTVLNMIVKVGARPVFVDCDLVTRNIDLAQIEAAITPATRAPRAAARGPCLLASAPVLRGRWPTALQPRSFSTGLSLSPVSFENVV